MSNVCPECGRSDDYNTLTPHQLAYEKYQLAVFFATLSETQARYIKIRAEHYKANRGKFKSDRAVEREFEASDDGIAMETNKVKMKSNRARSSAINSLLEVADNEARNNF